MPFLPDTPVQAPQDAPQSGAFVPDAAPSGERWDPNYDSMRAPSDLQISAYNPTLMDRTREFVRPLSDIITKLGTVPRGMPQIPHIPDVSEYSYLDPRLPGLAAAGNTAIDLVNQAPTPVGVGLMLGGAPAKIVGSLMSPVMAQHAADNLQPTIQTIQDPNKTTQQKFEAGINEGVATLGAVAPLAGLRRGPLEQVTDYGTITPEVMGEPTRKLALPEPLAARVAEKTPEQAVKAIREQAKLTEDPAKKAKLIDVADRMERQIAQNDTAAQKQQAVVDAHDAQVKMIEDQKKAVEKDAADQQKAQQDSQKLALAQAKAQGEQTQAIMEAQTPPEPLQAQKPMVLANSASQVAKNIEDNPENAQAQLNQMTKAQPPAAAPQPQAPNAIQVQGADAQMLRQPEAQPQNPLAVSGVGDGNTQPQGPAGAPAQEALKPIPKNVGIEYLGKKSLAVDGVGPEVDQWQVMLPGEKRGVTMTADMIRHFGYQPPEPPETIVSAALKDEHGNIHTGKMHGDIFNTLEDHGLAPGANASDEGFVTSKGRFVSRAEALKIAEKTNQLNEDYKKIYASARQDMSPESRDFVKDGLSSEELESVFPSVKNFKFGLTAEDLKSEKMVTVYRGEAPSSPRTKTGGGWFTTDRALAESAAQASGNFSPDGKGIVYSLEIPESKLAEFAKAAKAANGPGENGWKGEVLVPKELASRKKMVSYTSNYEPAQAAPAQEAPRPAGFVPDGPSVRMEDYPQPPPDNLAGRQQASRIRSQRGAAGADVVGGAGGAATGGAYGYVTARKRDDETDEQFQTRRLMRMFLGMAGGGLAGSSAMRLFGSSAAVRNAKTLTKVQNEAKGIDTVPEWYQKLRQTGPMVKFREAINNSRAVVKDMVGNAAQAGTEFDDRANPYATGKVYAAKVAEAQRKAGVVMDDLQKGVVEAGKASGIGVDNFVNRFNVWMEARHTPDYNKHLADLHKANGGIGAPPVGRLSDTEALQVLADAKTDGLEPVFSNLRDGYRSVITSIRDLLEDGGLITPETRKAWETKFPEYIPMNRIMPDEDIDSAIIGHIGGGPGISVLGSGVRKISGSDLNVSDIAGNLMANWTDAITRVQKNEVAKSAGYFFKNLEFDGEPYPGIEVRSPKVIGTSGDHPIQEPFKPENMVSYMVKGKPQWIVFRDPKIATAFSNLNPESQNRLMRIIATPTRILSRAFTGYNLDFLVPNLVRDRQSAAWKAISQGDVGGAAEQINPVRHVSDPAIVSQWIAGHQSPDTQLFQQMMDDGGMPGGYASSTRQKSHDFVETLRRADTNIGTWSVQKVQHVFNFLSEISEGSTRFRAYKRALELGASRQEAAIQALNSSIDFNQKGTVTPSMGAFYAFFNPSAQGGVNAVKNLLRSKDAMAVLLAGLVGVGSAVDAWNRGFDPEWKKRKSFAYARTNGIPLIYGTDPETKEIKFFQIPISQEMRAVKAVADFANEYGNGEIKAGDNLQDELGRVGGAIVAGANPLGADPINHKLSTVTPTVGRPLLEIAANRDYADRPIIPDRLHDSPLIQAQAQRKLETYDNRTGRMAIALADLLKSHFNVEVSPEHMKYLVNSYGGGPARTVSSSINSLGGEQAGFKASDLPVVGSFMRRATTEGLEKTTPLYKNTEQQLSDAKTQGELATQQSKLFFSHTFDKLEPSQWVPFWREAEAKGLIPKDMNFRKQIINDMTDKIKGRGDVDKLVGQFSVDNGERAAYYASRKRDFKSEPEYLTYLQDQATKKLLTPKMVPQIKQYLDATK